MELKDFVRGDVLRVLVRPNSARTEFLGMDKARGLPKIAFKAPPDKGKANKELVRFVSKQLGRRVEIKTGMASKDKILHIIH
ncbi:YggU family protein [Candidatus Woesearchaeota archaeon]|nr:YggU family protein [Candidatus Woesearchaeota archaeon]